MDRKKFFDAVRKPLFGGRLNQQQVDGLQAILREAERRSLDANSTAYILATVHWESAKTFRPDIREFGRGKGKKYGKPAGPYGKIYYGRGWPQLTWFENYMRQGDKLGLPLGREPDQALSLQVTSAITFGGMLDGDFTGLKLSQYVGRNGGDFVGARRVVNGTDRAHTIAALADKYLAALAASRSPAEAPLPRPRPQSRANPDTVKDAAGTAGAATGGTTTVAPAPTPEDAGGVSWGLYGGLALLTISLLYLAWRYRHPIGVHLSLAWDAVRRGIDQL